MVISQVMSHLCWQARTTFTLTNLSSQFVNLFALKPSQTFVLLVPSLQPQQITCLRPSITFTNCTWDQILLDTVPYTILIYIYIHMIRYIHPAAWSCIILHPPSTNKSACTHCYFGAVGPPSSVGSPIQAHRSTSFPGYRPPSHTQDFQANQCINWIKYLAKEPYHASLTLLQLHSHLWMKGHLTRKELLSHHEARPRCDGHFVSGKRQQWTWINQAVTAHLQSQKQIYPRKKKIQFQPKISNQQPSNPFYTVCIFAVLQ